MSSSLRNLVQAQNKILANILRFSHILEPSWSNWEGGWLQRVWINICCVYTDQHTPLLPVFPLFSPEKSQLKIQDSHLKQMHFAGVWYVKRSPVQAEVTNGELQTMTPWLILRKHLCFSKYEERVKGISRLHVYLLIKIKNQTIFILNEKSFKE